MEMISKKLVAHDLILKLKDHNITLLTIGAGLAMIYLFSIAGVTMQGCLLVGIFLGWRYYGNMAEIMRLRGAYFGD